MSVSQYSVPIWRRVHAFMGVLIEHKCHGNRCVTQELEMMQALYDIYDEKTAALNAPRTTSLQPIAAKAHAMSLFTGQ